MTLFDLERTNCRMSLLLPLLSGVGRALMLEVVLLRVFSVVALSSESATPETVPHQ